MRYLSLFSGIEAASVAWQPLGWTCVAVAEIEPFPAAVLAHHYPDVPNLGDVTAITDEQIAALGPIDVVIGGSPCQDLSVAGKRAGLAGERSGLFHEQLRIFHAARHLCGARFLVWENVPGTFSSHGGRDFAVVVGAMAGCELPVPDDGWGTEGVALGRHGLVEWAVLDAQWFGVAQRRRRVFAVLDVGDWSSRPPILLERDSLRGDSAPSREAGESVAGSLVARAGRNGGARNSDVSTGHVIAFGGNNQSGPIDVATARNACASASGRMDFESETFLVQPAHTLRGEGSDASDDGTGSGTPLVPVPGDPCHPLAAGAHAPAVAFMADDYKDGGYEEAETSRPLTTSADRTRAAPIVAPALTSSNDPSRSPQSSEVTQQIGAVYASAMQVRRLTPVECARLQGFPDDYLSQVPWRGKTPPADGPMYKALGNSMAVPVIRWIGQRIEAAA